MRVAIVVVNWNGASDTEACVASLLNLRDASWHVYIVENGSTDDSAGRLRRLASAHADHVTLVDTGANLGFAGGNNAALRPALAAAYDAFWLLNNDAVVEPGALAELVGLAGRHPDADVFGSWIVFDSDPDVLWFGGGTYQASTGHIAHDHYGATVADALPGGDAPTDWVSGCSLFVRARYVRRHGLLDEDLFLYQEDVEWQLRADPRRPQGWLVRLPLVRHKVGRSTGTTDGPFGRFFMSRNFLRVARRHGLLSRWLLRWAYVYLALPLARGRLGLVRAALVGARHVASPGPVAVAAVRRLIRS